VARMTVALDQAADHGLTSGWGWRAGAQNLGDDLTGSSAAVRPCTNQICAGLLPWVPTTGGRRRPTDSRFPESELEPRRACALADVF
jgi:hypothetical protein